MTIWLILLMVTMAGGIGGAINALMSDNGFVAPQKESTQDGVIVRPGFLGNCLIGGIAAAISWGLYGPFAAYALMGQMENPGTPPFLTLSAAVGAVLVGIGGARWLTNEVDKSLLRAAASQAAAHPPSQEKSAQMLMASPAQALRLAGAPSVHE